MMGKNHLLAHTASVALMFNAAEFVSRQSAGRWSLFSPVNVNSLQYVATFVRNNLSLSLIAILLFVLGSLFPDVDNKKSLLGRWLHLPFEHRTWTHTIWFVIPFAVLAYFKPVFWAFVLGQVLHLFWDNFSYSGVAYFYPITKYRSYPNGAKVKMRHKLKIYRTKEWTEYFVVFILLLGAGVSSYFLWIK